VRDPMRRHGDCLGCRMAGRRRGVSVPAADPEERPVLADA